MNFFPIQRGLCSFVLLLYFYCFLYLKNKVFAGLIVMIVCELRVPRLVHHNKAALSTVSAGNTVASFGGNMQTWIKISSWLFVVGLVLVSIFYFSLFLSGAK